jgi:hypothetical protein
MYILVPGSFLLRLKDDEKMVIGVFQNIFRNWMFLI